MPSLLNRFPIASADNFEKVGKDWQAYRKSPSGTGPWKMKAWTPRERAELERNTEYWNKDRIPKTERLVLLPIPDVSTRTRGAAVGPGRLDRGAGARFARQAARRRLQDRNQRHPAYVALHALHAAGRADRRHPRAQGDEPRDRPRRHREGAERAGRAGGRLRAARPSVVRQPELQDQVRPGRGQEADGRGGLRAGQAAQDQDRDLDLGLGPDVSADHERGDPAAMGRGRHRRRVPGDGLERAAERHAARARSRRKASNSARST